MDLGAAGGGPLATGGASPLFSALPSSSSSSTSSNATASHLQAIQCALSGQPSLPQLSSGPHAANLPRTLMMFGAVLNVSCHLHPTAGGLASAVTYPGAPEMHRLSSPFCSRREQPQPRRLAAGSRGQHSDLQRPGGSVWRLSIGHEGLQQRLQGRHVALPGLSCSPGRRQRLHTGRWAGSGGRSRRECMQAHWNGRCWHEQSLGKPLPRSLSTSAAIPLG